MDPRQPGVDRASRFLAGLPASLSIPGRDLPCRAHDLSRTGVLLVGDLPVPPASEISLTIRSPGGDLQLTTAGRVIRCDEDPDDGKTIIGVEFLGVHPDDRSTLEALIARVVEGVAPAALEDLSENATPQQVRAALEQVPLPHRMALATRGRPKERDILIRDPNPAVIDGLARNPSLLPQEVLAILRMPGLLPHTLETIGRDPRWSANAQVLERVAAHRNTPLSTADRILSRLPPSSQRKVLQASDLKPALRNKLLRLLRP
jgi:hypothetical protein